jgi:hypothetical protein
MKDIEQVTGCRAILIFLSSKTISSITSLQSRPSGIGRENKVSQPRLLSAHGIDDVDLSNYQRGYLHGEGLLVEHDGMCSMRGVSAFPVQCRAWTKLLDRCMIAGG